MCCSYSVMFIVIIVRFPSMVVYTILSPPEVGCMVIDVRGVSSWRKLPSA